MKNKVKYITAAYKIEPLFKDTFVNIEDYGVRQAFNGWTKCGTTPPDFLRFPKRPTLANAAAKILWAISLASTVKQDRVTRFETVRICELAYAGRINNPCVFSVADLARTAKIQGYWRDLFKVGFIQQYRRCYGKLSDQHFDVVYELTATGAEYLAMARARTMAAMIGTAYPVMRYT